MQDENEFLEFKEQLDFSSKRTKAHFLKEILSLANTLHGPAFLIIGVEDKTKRLVGVRNIAEEQLHQIVTEYCKPPIPFSYTIVEYEGVDLGIIQVFRSNFKPHTLKTRFTYQDTNGQRQELQETQIFVRHGSIIGEATREEILALTRDRESNVELLSRTVNELEKIEDEIHGINYYLREISNQIYDTQPREFNDRVVEGTFISIIVGCISAWMFGIGWFIFPIPIMGLWFTISIVFSAFGVIDFGFFRAFINSILLGSIITALLLLEIYYFEATGFLVAQSPLILKLVGGALVGAISGTIGSYLILRTERILRFG